MLHVLLLPRSAAPAIWPCSAGHRAPLILPLLPGLRLSCIMDCVRQDSHWTTQHVVSWNPVLGRTSAAFASTRIKVQPSRRTPSTLLLTPWAAMLYLAPVGTIHAALRGSTFLP